MKPVGSQDLMNIPYFLNIRCICVTQCHLWTIISTLKILPLVLVWLWRSCHFAAEGCSLSLPPGLALRVAQHMKLF